MTLDEVLASLFPGGHALERGSFGTVHGTGRLEGGGEIALVGIVDRTPLGVDGALLLASRVLAVIDKGGGVPIMMLVDTASQSMTRRDELLGLNEYLAHLSKSLALAAVRGHRTVGVLYGRAAAGAFIATALSTQVLAAVRGAEPSVMDLPSIARVTKLPLDQLERLAQSTPIFAPGLDPMFAVGAVAQIWDASKPLAEQLAALLRQSVEARDPRDAIGLERKGRLLAAGIAQRVAKEVDALESGTAPP
jgi:malonate decarboxylase gamma subunit